MQNIVQLSVALANIIERTIPMNALEVSILKNLNSAFSCDILDAFFKFVSFLGNKGLIWIIIALILAITPKSRKCGLTAGIALIFCLLIGNAVLKPLFGRVRPYDFDTTLKLIIPALSDPSFPSGHTMAAFATAEAIRNCYQKAGVIVYIGAVLMGLSRIYLCVHYPTDVIFGAVFGIIFGVCAHIVIERTKICNQK